MPVRYINARLRSFCCVDIKKATGNSRQSFHLWTTDETDDHAGTVVCAESEPEPRSDNYSEQQKTDVNGKVAIAGQASETEDESWLKLHRHMVAYLMHSSTSATVPF